MPKHALDCLNVGPGAHREPGRRMSQPMRLESLEPSGPRRRVEDVAAKVQVPQYGSSGAAEHQVVLPFASHVRREVFGQESGYRHGTLLVVLRGIPEQSAPHLRHRLDYL